MCEVIDNTFNIKNDVIPNVQFLGPETIYSLDRSDTCIESGA